jgi:hypothetical protein
MRFYLSIDDTDNSESPGSGQLAEVLVEELQGHSLGVCRTMPFSPISALFSENQCSQYQLYGCA